MNELNADKKQLSLAVQKETKALNEVSLIKRPLIETIACKYCKELHTYEIKRRKKSFCSNKCGVAYHGKYVRDKAKLAASVTAYYSKNYAKRLIVTSKYSAKKKGVVHRVTEAYLNKQLSMGTCQATGLPISSNIGTGQTRGAYSPSLDRIDNSIGYIDSNVRIVSWIFNLAKNKFSDRDLNNLAVTLVASHLSPVARKEFEALLPANLVAGLPAGYKI